MNEAPEAVQVASVAITALALAWAGRRLPWYKLEGDPEAVRILLVATAALSPDEIASPVRAVIAGWGRAEVLMEQVTGIDVAAREVDCVGAVAILKFLAPPSFVRITQRPS